MDAYSTGGGGKLKLKGSKVSDGRVKKKKSKKSSSAITTTDNDNKAGEITAEQRQNEEVLKSRTKEEEQKGEGESRSEREGSSLSATMDEPAVSIQKTEAEKRYEEMRRRRLQERLKREGVKTHKERVEELNKYLSRLSEHHDMPKIGPG